MTVRHLPGPAALLLLLLPAAAAPVRVSFLDTNAAREDTLQLFAEAGCEPASLETLRRAIRHYYRTPLALDTSRFPPARDGFHEFASIGGFIAALGTNQLSFLPHDFELNCFHTALLLAAPGMDLAAGFHDRKAPYFAVQVDHHFTEWVKPAASLAEVYALAHRPGHESALHALCGIEFTDRHRALLAAFYQYQALPLDATESRVAAETRAALRRHWTRTGIRFPDRLALILLHRASVDLHLVVTDHMGVLLPRGPGGIYLEKAGGRGPFLRLDVADLADLAAYFSTVTWPDFPHNFLSVNDGRFLDVPLRPWPLAPAPPISPVASPPAP